jgi:hypothetical protein
MLCHITPIFLTSILGANMTHLGFIEGLAEAIANLLSCSWCPSSRCIFTGFIWDIKGPSWAYFYGASGALIAILMILRISNHQDLKN